MFTNLGEVFRKQTQSFRMKVPIFKMDVLGFRIEVAGLRKGVPNLGMDTSVPEPRLQLVYRGTSPIRKRPPL